MDMEIIFSGGKKVDAEYKDFTIRTDQSPEGGGDGSAPEPFDLFFASIGTCAGIYVLSFCQNRDLPTENVKLFMSTEINPESDMFDKVNIQISVPDTFPEKYHKALVRVAEKCTVKKHIAKGLPDFNVTLGVGSDI